MPDITNLRNTLYKTLEYKSTAGNAILLFGAADGSDAYKFGCYVSFGTANFYFEADNNGTYKVTNARYVAESSYNPSVTIYKNGNKYYAKLNSGTFGEVTTKREIFYGTLGTDLTTNVPAEVELTGYEVVTEIDFKSTEIVGSLKVANSGTIEDLNVEGTVSVENDINVTNNVTVNNNLTSNDVVVASTTTASNNFTSNDINVSLTTQANNNFTSNDVVVASTTTANNNFTSNDVVVASTTTANNDFTSNDVVVASTTTVSNNFTSNDVNVSKVTTVSNNFTSNDLFVTSSTVAANLNVVENGEVKNLVVKDNAVVNTLESTNLRSGVIYYARYKDREEYHELGQLNPEEYQALINTKYYTKTEDAETQEIAYTEYNIQNLQSYLEYPGDLYYKNGDEYELAEYCLTKLFTKKYNEEHNAFEYIQVTGYVSNILEITDSGSVKHIDVTDKATVKDLNVDGLFTETASDGVVEVRNEAIITDLDVSNSMRVANGAVAGTAVANNLNADSMTVKGGFVVNDENIFIESDNVISNPSSLEQLYANRLNLNKIIIQSKGTNEAKGSANGIAYQVIIKHDDINDKYVYTIKQICRLAKESEIITSEDSQSLNYANITDDIEIIKLGNKYYDVKKQEVILDSKEYDTNHNMKPADTDDRAIINYLQSSADFVQATNLLANTIKFTDTLTVRGTTELGDTQTSRGAIYFGDTDTPIRGVTADSHTPLAVSDDFYLLTGAEEGAKYFVEGNEYSEFSNLDSATFNKDKTLFYTYDLNQQQYNQCSEESEYDNNETYYIKEKSYTHASSYDGINKTYKFFESNDYVSSNMDLIRRTLNFADGALDITKRRRSRVILALQSSSPSYTSDDLYAKYLEKIYSEDIPSTISFDQYIYGNQGYHIKKVTGDNEIYYDLVKGTNDELVNNVCLLVFIDDDGKIQIERRALQGNSIEYSYINNYDTGAYDFDTNTWSVTKLSITDSFKTDAEASAVSVLIPAPAKLDSYYTYDETTPEGQQNYELKTPISLLSVAFEATDDYLVTSKALNAILNNGSSVTTPLASNLYKKDATYNVLYQSNATNTGLVDNAPSDGDYLLNQNGNINKPKFSHRVVKHADATAQNGDYAISKTNGLKTTLYLTPQNENHDLDNSIPTIKYINDIIGLGYTLLTDMTPELINVGDSYYLYVKNKKLNTGNVNNVQYFERHAGSGQSDESYEAITSEINSFDNFKTVDTAANHNLYMKTPASDNYLLATYTEVVRIPAKTILRYTASDNKIYPLTINNGHKYIYNGDYIITLDDVEYTVVYKYDNIAEKYVYDTITLTNYNLDLISSHYYNDGTQLFTAIGSTTNSGNLPMFDHDKKYKAGVDNVYNTLVQSSISVSDYNNLSNINGLTASVINANTSLTTPAATINTISSVNSINNNGSSLGINASDIDLNGVSSVEVKTPVINIHGVDDSFYIKASRDIETDALNSLDISAKNNVISLGNSINITTSSNLIDIKAKYDPQENTCASEILLGTSQSLIKATGKQEINISDYNNVSGELDIKVKDPGNNNAIYSEAMLNSKELSTKIYGGVDNNTNGAEIYAKVDPSAAFNKLELKGFARFDSATNTYAENLYTNNISTFSGNTINVDTNVNLVNAPSTAIIVKGVDGDLNLLSSTNKLIIAYDNVKNGAELSYNELKLGTSNVVLNETSFSGSTIDASIKSLVASTQVVSPLIKVTPGTSAQIYASLNQADMKTYTRIDGFDSITATEIDAVDAISAKDLDVTSTATVNTLNVRNGISTDNVNATASVTAPGVYTSSITVKDINSLNAATTIDVHGNVTIPDSLTVNTNIVYNRDNSSDGDANYRTLLFIDPTSKTVKYGNLSSIGYIDTEYQTGGKIAIPYKNKSDQVVADVGIIGTDIAIKGPAGSTNVDLAGDLTVSGNIKANSLQVACMNVLNITETDLSTSDALIELGRTRLNDDNIGFSEANYTGIYTYTRSNSDAQSADAFSRYKVASIPEELYENIHVYYGDSYKTLSALKNDNLFDHAEFACTVYDASSDTEIKNSAISDDPIASKVGSAELRIMLQYNGDNINYSFYIGDSTNSEKKYYASRGVFVDKSGVVKVGIAIGEGGEADNSNKIIALGDADRLLQDVLTRAPFDSGNSLKYSTDINASGRLVALNTNSKRIENANYYTVVDGKALGASSGISIQNGMLNVNVAGSAPIRDNLYNIEDATYGVIAVQSNINNKSSIAAPLTISNGMLGINAAIQGENSDTTSIGVFGVNLGNGLAYDNDYLKLRMEIATKYTDPTKKGTPGAVTVNPINGLNYNDYGVISISPATDSSLGTMYITPAKASSNNGLTISTCTGVATISISTATNEQLGTVKVSAGNGLSYNDDTISVNPADNSSNPGTVKVNGMETVVVNTSGNLAVDIDNLISTDHGLTKTTGKLDINPANSNDYGVVKVTPGNGISISTDGVITMSIATVTASTINDNGVDITTYSPDVAGAVKVNPINGLTYDSSYGTIGMNWGSSDNYGTVKVTPGHGLSIADGTILMALGDSSNPGAVSVSAAYGLSIDSNGVISMRHADANDYGTIKLQSSGNITVTEDGVIGMSDTPTFTSVTASTVTANQFYYPSDRRLKENIHSLDYNAVDIINTIDTVSYNYKSNPNDNLIGVIAQDIEHIDIDGFSFVHEDENGILSVKESKFVYLLIKAVQEQSAEIKELRKEINKLKNEETGEDE